MSNEKETTIRKYALKNAVKFDGEATVGPVMGKVMGESEECRKDPTGTKELVEQIVNEVNKLSLDEQTSRLKKKMPEYFEEKDEEEINRLPEIEGEEIVMRMAPYPSGPLHIGNSRMVILNDEYVKRNDGKLVLFYDDTIGSEKKKPLIEAFDLIKEGLEWLGVEWHETHYKSKRMEIYYEYGQKIIEMGEAYVCECSAEKLRNSRKKGIECEHRSRTVEENLAKWNKMLEGGFEEGEVTLRLKTDMEYPDPAFRDRVLFRVSNQEHPRVGNKYHVWPLLEFSWAIDDHLLNMTHILRGKDLVMEDKMEEYIWDLFGWEKCEFLHYGMLRLRDVRLSKSEFQQQIKEGNLRGWDDPRTWSLQSLKRRGIQPDAIRDFILDFGMSKTDIEVPASKLYAKNRELIDEEANRYFFVKDPVEIELIGEIDIDEAEIPRHPDFSDRGNRKIKVKDKLYISEKDWKENEGKEVRLKNLCNIKLDGHKGYITDIANKDILKIQWLPGGKECRVEQVDGSYDEGIVENNLDEVDMNDIVQFERYGFVKILDKSPWMAAYGHR
ncbi:MAG: glutamate--tRNA ligase [Candidatus Saliniplasma sp.]